MKKLILFFLLLAMSAHAGFSQMRELKSQIKEIVADKNMKLGVALYDFQTHESLAIHGNRRFPMQSVYKFPIAVAVLDCVAKGEFSLSDSVELTDKELYADLWCPLRERYPDGGRVVLSEVLEYMVAHSDNGATDFLLNMVGDAVRVQRIIDSLGAKNIKVRNSEREMQASWTIQFDNYATPCSMVAFLRRFALGELLSTDNTSALWRIMANTSTGSVKRLIPQGVVVAHKTGSSGVSSAGVTAAQNDVGIMEFEDGRLVAFAIFITDSSETTDTNYGVIAKISRAIYDHYNPPQQQNQPTPN